MSYPQPSVEELPTKTPRWYRRRGPQAAIAGLAASALVAAGLGIGAAAFAEADPYLALDQARNDLFESPVGVTITSPDQSGEITLIRTDEGAQISIDAPEKGVTFAVALVAERLYLRVDADELGQLSSNPMALGLASGFGSLAALLNGEWVSIDVSEDSEVLAAIKELGAGEATDQDALKAAAEEFGASLEAIGEDVRQPLKNALEDNVSVAQQDTALAGPQGSDHYLVTLDRAAVIADLEPVLREALQDAMSAIDTFVAQAGQQFQGGPEWTLQRDKILSAFDEAMAGSGEAADSVDVWIADGEFTQIVTKHAKFVFDQNPQLDATVAAVSMDEDLLRLLPLLGTFGLPGLPGFPAAA